MIVLFYLIDFSIYLVFAQIYMMWRYRIEYKYFTHFIVWFDLFLYDSDNYWILIISIWQ